MIELEKRRQDDNKNEELERQAREREREKEEVHEKRQRERDNGLQREHICKIEKALLLRSFRILYHLTSRRRKV